jgi:hypothetical protein
LALVFVVMRSVAMGLVLCGRPEIDRI